MQVTWLAECDQLDVSKGDLACFSVLSCTLLENHIMQIMQGGTALGYNQDIDECCWPPRTKLSERKSKDFTRGHSSLVSPHRTPA
jgi:hypothetical protein